MERDRNEPPPYRERVGAFSRWIAREDRRLLGSFLKEIRSRQGVSQGDLAIKLDLPQSVLSKIEKGHREVSLLEFVAICEALEESSERAFRDFQVIRTARPETESRPDQS